MGDSNQAEATADIQDGSSFFLRWAFAAFSGTTDTKRSAGVPARYTHEYGFLKSIYINVDSSHPLDIVPSSADSFRFLLILGETYHFCWNAQAALFHSYSYTFETQT